MMRCLTGCLCSILLIGCSSDNVIAEPELTDEASVSLPPSPEQGTEAGANVSQMTVTPVRAESAEEGGATNVDIALQFDGLSRTLRGYFRDPEILNGVGATLHGVVAPPANVHVSASGASGVIKAVVTPGALNSPLLTPGGQVDLSVLTPITTSMVGYRELVAGKFDFRVQSFDASVSVVGESSWCTFTATGQHPPTGEEISECFDVDGEELCGVVTGTMLHLTDDVAAKLGECLH